ncbi:MAG: asparaginase [Candidatus Viridilinea halotolerans]|uniref:asparaginase n=1 Tax=Candidatus Viridilinea halotolerans TaxID=2491704 RepID=A0A426U122_9CHLR|nr:MAG: asparaginase [Candidatus Viridilinea halotolerans]
MARILVLTTGGTIANRRGPSIAGAIPSLKGDELLAMLPRGGIELFFEEFANVPSSHVTPASGLELARRVAAMLARDDVDGIVITHGTDTLEESVYLLDLSLAITKPVVVTGAVRATTSVSYDGLANLAAAARVAATPAAADLGVVVVFDEEIHAAAAVQNLHPHARGAFGSPGLGPLGRVEGERVWLARRPFPRKLIACEHLEEMVDLIRLTQGADVRLLRHSIEDGVAGIVIEAFGGGRVPPWWLPHLSEAIKRRVTVLVASRCGTGGLGDDYGYVGAYHDLQRIGVLFAHNLSGPKARIKLMLALGAARGPSELRGFFDEQMSR